MRLAAAAAAGAVLAGSLSGCAGLARTETAAAAATAPDCLVDKCVALTFDDGPGSATTGRLLDILAEKDVRATFFVLGKQVRAHPGLVARAATEGHQIGDHTWDHERLTSLSEAAVLRQINRTADEIEVAAGIRPDVMRPPDGAINGPVAKLVGLPAILWSVDTRDWLHRDTEKVADAVRDGVRPGSVVLMHDIYSSTVDAVPRVIDRLKAHGYFFVTIRQLFDSRLRSGRIYKGGEGAYEKALARAAALAEAREIEEYLRNSGQPEIGAVPGPVTPIDPGNRPPLVSE